MKSSFLCWILIEFIGCKPVHDRSHHPISLFAILLWVYNTFQISTWYLDLHENTMRSVHSEPRRTKELYLERVPFLSLWNQIESKEKQCVPLCQMNARHNMARCNHEHGARAWSSAGSLLRAVTKRRQLGFNESQDVYFKRKAFSTK